MCSPSSTEPDVTIDCVRCDCPTSKQHGICRPYQWSPDMRKCIDCNRVI